MLRPLAKKYLELLNLNSNLKNFFSSEARKRPSCHHGTLQSDKSLGVVFIGARHSIEYWGDHTVVYHWTHTWGRGRWCRAPVWPCASGVIQDDWRILVSANSFYIFIFLRLLCCVILHCEGEMNIMCYENSTYLNLSERRNINFQMCV